jgi:hypothetical protein
MMLIFHASYVGRKVYFNLLIKLLQRLCLFEAYMLIFISRKKNLK